MCAQRGARTDAAGAAPRRALVVDDETDIQELLQLTLLRMGVEAELAGSVAEAERRLAGQAFDLCLTDMRLPDGEGLDVVRLIGSRYPHIPVAVITAYGSTENAVAALKAGAFDYVAKPLALEHLRNLVKAALNLTAANADSASIGPELLGDSPAMTAVRELIGRLARSQAPVYLTGESGSGKELAARLIHGQSARRERAFVAVNCGAIPESLMESEFFGYRKGAFTGAEADRDGFFQAAHGGTLFLDEVAELPLAMQVKLLRAIQEKKVRKVGATQEEDVDVRVLSATHQNLAQCVEAGRFRQDLYYRLNVIELRMPALREMAEDIPAVARALLARAASQAGMAEPNLAADALRALKGYAFPGNVRELENILERALALCDGAEIGAADLNLPRVAVGVATPATPLAERQALPEYLDQLEKQAILDALEKTRFNKTAAARMLGITFRALRYRMERLGLD